MFDKISLFPGTNKLGEKENFDVINFDKGKIYSIVGYTGSGKSQLIKDIEELVCKESVTNRTIKLDNKIVNNNLEYAEKNLIAHLSQNMNFIVDMTVEKFIQMHAKCREIYTENIVEEVIKLANEVTHEKIYSSDNLTRLSGGQTRALMISDIAIICNSPIVLIDEIENAGIDKIKALNLLVDNKKVVIVVTHDPLISFMADKRIVMKNGGVFSVIDTNIKEKELLKKLTSVNDYIKDIQEKIRIGEILC